MEMNELKDELRDQIKLIESISILFVVQSDRLDLKDFL